MIRSSLDGLRAAVTGRRAVRQCNRDVAGTQHRRSTRRPKSAGRARTEHSPRVTAPEFAESECAFDFKAEVAGLCDGLGEGRMDKLGNVQIARKREFRGGPHVGPHTSPVQEAWTALPPLVDINDLRPFPVCRDARCQHQLGNGFDRPGMGLRATISVSFGDE